MKYNDNGTFKDIYVKAADTLPVGTEVDFDGNIVPAGWEEVDINLFSGATIVSGYGFNNNGETYPASTRSYFDYIEVEAYQTYIMENISPAVTCFYDSNKTFISSTTGSTYSTPANTFYVRTAFVNTDPYTNATLKSRNYGGTKRIRKVEQSIGVLGKVLNNQSSSNQDTYSCDYINNSIATEYSLTIDYTSASNQYTACKIGQIAMISGQFLVSSVTTGTTTQVGTVPDELKPTQMGRSNCIVLDGGNGQLIGYGSLMIGTDGKILATSSIAKNYATILRGTIIYKLD